MVESATPNNIYIIIILFNPTKTEIDNVKNISSLFRGTIIDNSSKHNFNTTELNKMQYIALKKNIGIAAAHNIGIKQAINDTEARYIIFFDQDSDFPNTYPLEIAKEYATLRTSGINVGALGPTVIQKETGEVYKSAFHKEQVMARSFIRKPEIIASGCCVDKSVYNHTGLNNEEFFIDFVDSEWCFRLQSHGYLCGTTSNIIINHKVGRKEMHIGSHIIIISAPFRYYYQYRNLITMLPLSYVPFKWKFFKSVKFAIRFLYLPFCVNKGFDVWKYMIKGIYAGIKNIMK